MCDLMIYMLEMLFCAENDILGEKYTINVTFPVMGNLKVGDVIMLCPDGSVINLVGSYCEWPKKEPHYFIVG